MPKITTRCPECDANVRLSVDDDGDHEAECPSCEHTFTVSESQVRKARKSGSAAKPVRNRRADEDDEDEQPRKRRPMRTGGQSKAPIVIGAVVGGVVLLGGVIAAAIALSGKDEKPRANNDPVPQERAPRPNPAIPPIKAPNPGAPQANPSPNPPADPPADPQPIDFPQPGLPNDPPAKPPVSVPALPASAEDVFARAANFKPEGPLPELPPLPPVERRPMLALDPGGHTAFVRHVTFSPDAGRVVSVSEDKSVRFWDIATGEVVNTVRLPAGPDVEGTPFAGATSPDGKRLAIGGFPLGRGKFGIPIYILSMETGELLQVVEGARDVIQAIDFSPDGNLLAVGCGKGIVQVYDFKLQKWVVFFPLAHKEPVKHIRFHPKGEIAATVGRDKIVKVWDFSKTEPLAEINLSEPGPNVTDWTSDGKTLAVGCTSGEVRLYNLAGQPVKTVPPALENGKFPIQIARMKMLRGDKQVVFGGVAAAGWAGVVDLETGKRPVIIREHTNTVMAVNGSNDGALACSVGGEREEIIVWNTKDGAIVRKFQSASKGLWAVGWAKDGKSLAWGTINQHNGEGLCPLEHTIRLDEFLRGAPPKPADYMRHNRDDGRFSIKVNDFYTFTVFENGKALYQHKSRSDRIYSVTLLPGKGIVVGASFGMYLLETKSGKPIRDYRGDRGLTTSLSPSPDGRYFVSGSTDHVMRVWAVDREEPLLSIFSVAREWIAWTPQGYYACSPYGERLIAWQVNNGISKLPEVHPAVRFRASLYQPAVLKYLVPAGDMRLAMAMAGKFDRLQIAATGLAEVLPPGVVVNAPLTADDKPITIRATAEGTAKNPIIAMRLLIDGRPFNGAAGIKRFNKLQKAEADWEVKLTPGAHSIAVLAESPVSKGMSRPVVIQRAGKPALPDLYILAVGVSAYPGDLKLNFAASDATLFTQTLKARGKGVFNNIEVKLLTDKQGTKQNFREGLEWLQSKMSSKDVGIVFFSGHGGRDDATDKFYLIPVDVGPDLEQSCLSGEELKSRLENMPGRLVAILDACHSGAVTEIKPGRADNLVRDLMTDDYGVVVLASSLGRECSLESPLTKAGFYTLGLTEGMQGRADFNRDGVVYINELEYYAALRVQQLSGGLQNPTLGRPPTIRPFPISKR